MWCTDEGGGGSGGGDGGLIADCMRILGGRAEEKNHSRPQLTLEETCEHNRRGRQASNYPSGSGR